MTVTPNPFPGEQGVRIEKAVRNAVASGHVISVGDVLIDLRTDHTVSDDDFKAFFRALLDQHSREAVEAWVVSLVTCVHREGK
jgi:hypothetical protein